MPTKLAPGWLGRSQRWSRRHQGLALPRRLPTGEERTDSGPQPVSPTSVVSRVPDRPQPELGFTPDPRRQIKAIGSSPKHSGQQAAAPAPRRPSQASGSGGNVEVRPQFPETPFRPALRGGGMEKHTLSQLLLLLPMARPGPPPPSPPADSPHRFGPCVGPSGKAERQVLIFRLLKNQWLQRGGGPRESVGSRQADPSPPCAPPGDDGGGDPRTQVEKGKLIQTQEMKVGAVRCSEPRAHGPRWVLLAGSQVETGVRASLHSAPRRPPAILLTREPVSVSACASLALGHRPGKEGTPWVQQQR